MAQWLAAPDDGDLKKRARQSASLIKQFSRSFPFSKPRGLFWEGVFNFHDNQRNKAMKGWLRGLEAARDLGMPYDEGLLLLQLGAYGEGGEIDQQSCFIEAREIFETLNAVHDLERLSALSRQTGGKHG